MSNKSIHHRLFKLFLILFALTALIAGATHIAFTRWAKPALITFLEDQTKTNIEINTLTYRIPFGITATDITISDIPNARDTIHIDRLSVSSSLPAILSQRKIPYTFILDAPELFPATISCHGIFVPATTSIEADINTSYANTPLMLTLTTPSCDPLTTISADGSWGQLSFSTHIVHDVSSVTIKKLLIRLKRSYFDGTGSLAKTTPPALTLNGKAQCYLEELEQLLIGTQILDDPALLRGTVDLSFFMRAQLASPYSTMTTIMGTAPHISIDNIVVDNVSFAIDANEKNIALTECTAHGYNGLIKATTAVNIQQRPCPYKTHVEAHQIQLEQLQKALSQKPSKIAGTLNGTCDLIGKGANTSAISGTAWLTITNGKLFELPILKGLFSLINVADPLNVTFHNASGLFHIQNKRIYSNDVTLRSNDITLLARGSCGFDTTLDAMISTSINKPAQDQPADALSSLTRSLLTTAQKVISNIGGEFHVGGTIKNPKITTKTPVNNAIKGILDVFGGMKR